MTTADKVFQDLKGPLLSRLTASSGLIFTGPPDYVDYLAAYFGGASSHAYIRSDEPLEAWQRMLVGRHTLVVASDDEDPVASAVNLALAQLERPPRVVRLFGDLFVNAMSGGDLWAPSPQELMAPEVAYAIIGTPRSGTEFLCEALSATRVAGHPKEHVRSQTEALTRFCRFDPDRYLRILMSRQMTKNRVFGTKLISHFLLEHIKLCRPLEQTLTPFKYVRVSRRDLVGQAISAMLAFHTGTYHIRDEAEHQRYRERLANFQISPADLRRVEDLRQSFAVQRRQMDDFLQRHSITPLEVVFEDLIAEPVRSVNAVLSFLSVPTTVENVSVTVRKTQDEITESVRAMYLEGSYSS